MRITSLIILLVNFILLQSFVSAWGYKGHRMINEKAAILLDGELGIFLNKHNNEIKEYIVIGHTDTKGSKSYNLSLSIKRAKIVQDLLIAQGIDKSKIKVFGRGEESLAIFTPDNTRQPANRRVEIKKAN